MELNKILGAILGSLLIITAIGHIGESLVKVHIPKERSYIVEGVEETTSTEAGDTAGPKGPGPILALLAGANVEKGQQIAKKCLACHTFDEGGPNKIGPNLWNIVNRDIASVPGFAYSEAETKFEGNWDYDKLNQYLYNPAAYIKGNKMNFAGVKKDQERADLIAYLRSLSNNPAPLPEVTEQTPAPQENTPAATPPAEGTEKQPNSETEQPKESPTPAEPKP